MGRGRVEGAHDSWGDRRLCIDPDLDYTRARARRHPPGVYLERKARGATPFCSPGEASDRARPRAPSSAQISAEGSVPVYGADASAVPPNAGGGGAAPPAGAVPLYSESR